MSGRGHQGVGRGSEAGFTLVEVIVALGLLASVLLVMAHLFALANQQLDGGRNQSHALAVAKDVLEEMGSWGFEQSWAHYGFDGSASSYTIDSTSDAFAAKWQSVLEQELDHCRAEILVESVDESPPGPALRDADAIRIRVTVFWDEQVGRRSRSVSLATVRI